MPRSCRSTRSSGLWRTRSTGPRGEMILRGAPLIMISRRQPPAGRALSDFVRQVRIPFFNTQMGKGAVTGGSNLYMLAAALSGATTCIGRSTGPT